jgi:AbrB family looped-hinge helix DNA binding protein
MALAKLTSKGQITIPKAVRQQLGLRTGDQIEFVRDNGGFRIEKTRPVDRFARWRGRFTDLAGQDIDATLDDWRGR